MRPEENRQLLGEMKGKYYRQSLSETEGEVSQLLSETEGEVSQ